MGRNNSEVVGTVSYPILYKPTENVFNHNGCGILGDCASCIVTEEANGAFELSMQYPMDGIHFEDIQSRSIIKAKPDQFREPQLFRVYKISKPNMSGIVNIDAQHISYDLSGVAVQPFTAESVQLALSGLRSNAVGANSFNFWTDKSTAGKFTVSYPASIRSRLGGVQGSILDVYGGEYEFDNFTVKLHNNRGMDRGVSVRYGKNLVSLKQEENCQNIATGIYPYWQNQETGAVVQLPEKVVNAPGEYDFQKIRTVDFTSYFETEPTEEQLRNATERYIQNNEIGVPIVSLDVSFVQLQKSEEYKHLKLLERVSLFDTLSVEFPALKVSAKAKAVKIVYNVLLDRVEAVTLGSVRANIADTIVEQQKQIEQAPTKTDLQLAKEAATAWLTNGKGYAYFRKDANGNIVDILFMDTQDPSTAVNVMRVGQSGIGFSNSGVNGEYISAWTIDGKFNADFITAGTLYGLLFKAGMIESTDGSLKIDLSNNKVIIDVSATSNTSTGKVEISREGIIGYGYDYDNGEYVKTLLIMPGYKSSQYGGSPTTINSFQSPFGLDLTTGGGEKQILSLGIASTPVQIKRKTVSWKDNGDGTYTLIGQ
jgi:phage minor structural protein